LVSQGVQTIDLHTEADTLAATFSVKHRFEISLETITMAR
jgi:hypothetical protein